MLNYLLAAPDLVATMLVAVLAAAEEPASGTLVQPTSVALPGNAQTLLNNVLGWLVTLAGAAAVGSFIVVGIRIMVGWRRNGQLAADAIGSLGWVFAGGIVVASAAYLANQALVSAG